MASSTIIRLLPAQVPLLWDTIKLGAVRAAEIPEPAIPAFCQRLLHGLLSEKVQCFVRLNEERVVLTLFITQVRENMFTGERELDCWALYSFKLIDEDSAKQGVEAMKKVALAAHCSQMITMSRHPRLWKLYESVGWSELRREYVYPLEEV